MNKLEGADQYILSFCQDHEEGSKKKNPLPVIKMRAIKIWSVKVLRSEIYPWEQQ